MAIPTEDWSTVQMMHKYGGSFVKQLAELLERADYQNYSILKRAFPDYFEQYRRMAFERNANI